MGKYSRASKKFYEELEKQREMTRCQEITDCPPQLYIEDRLCNFFLEYGLVGSLWKLDTDKEKTLAYISGYKDAETNEIVINSGGYTPDLAIRNLLNRLHNAWYFRPKDVNGKPLCVVQCILYKGDEVSYDIHIDKHYVVKPDYSYDENGNYRGYVCPMCGSDKLKVEPYNTLCPEALAGSKGTRYYCDCGYHWDDVEIMM